MNYQAINIQNPIRLCFLGCGNITKVHARSARNCKENIQCSFASRARNKAAFYLKEFKGINAYGSYEEAIASSQEEVIMINTPPNLHFDLAQKALKAGKHVIVEKPPFFIASDFDVLGSIAEQKGLQLMVAENYYYKPLRTAIRNIIAEKSIGDPLFIVINATKLQAPKNDWRDDPSIARHGALFEGGIHWINFINNLGLQISNINGFIPKQKTDLEKSIQVIAKTKEGVIINLFYSWEVNTVLKGLRISRIYGRSGSVTFETNGVFVWTRGKKSRLSFPGFRHISGSQPMFDDFMIALRNGKPPAFTWQMAKQDLTLIEKIYKDIEQNEI